MRTTRPSAASCATSDRSGLGLGRGGGADDLGHAQAELLVDDDDLATRDRAAVDREVYRLARHAVQGDDGPRSEAERVADRHARAADLDGELDRHGVQA